MARALEVPFHRSFYDGDALPKLENLLKRQGRSGNIIAHWCAIAGDIDNDPRSVKSLPTALWADGLQAISARVLGPEIVLSASGEMQRRLAKRQCLRA